MMRDEAISHVLERLPHHRDAAESYRSSGLGWLALLWRRANGGHGEQCAELLAREQHGVADEQYEALWEGGESRNTRGVGPDVGAEHIYLKQVLGPLVGLEAPQELLQRQVKARRSLPPEPHAALP